MEDAGFDEEKDLPVIKFGFVSINELKQSLSGLAPAQDNDSSELIYCYHEIWNRINLTKFKGEDFKKLASYREKVREKILYWSNNLKAEQLEQAS